MEFIPVNEPYLDDKDKKMVLSCMDSGWISSEGPYVKEFEEKFAQSVNRKYAIAVSSGTAALDVSVASLNIGKDDEVIMPSFTIISCVHQIIRAGAKPIFIDSDLETWNINVLDIEKNITKKTKALLIPHIYGLPVDMDFIEKICKKYNLLLIEDAAEMIGQTCGLSKCGSFGDLSTFSFYANKHITTGEGGMIVTNSEHLYERCRSLRNLCFQNQQRFIHSEIGWNYRMTNIQAGLGLAQLERLDQIIKRKREFGAKYHESLISLKKFINLPLKKTIFADNIYWVFGIVLKNTEIFNTSKELIEKLSENKIGSRPFFYPLHLQPILLKNNANLKNITLPNSENLYKKGLYLPSGLALRDKQIEYVCDTLERIFL